jgi:murein DD-endopeptidase MepM/ murein hydrolase activator NlpD
MRSCRSKQRGISFLALRLFLPIGLGAAAVVLALATHRIALENQTPASLEPVPGAAEHAARRSASAAEAAAVEYEIHRGETVSEVLRHHGLGPEEAWRAVEALSPHLDLRRVRAGERYAVIGGGEVVPAAFRFEVAGKGRVTLARRSEGWESTWVPFERVVRVASAQGELVGSLDGSLERVGAPASLAYEMAEVLQWDLDFNRDLRRGDRFEVLFEEIYLDGRLFSVGDVLALRYDNGGRLHEVYRWGRDGGYYTADGRPLEKMFLRSPLQYSRVTSRFSHRRFHPVLKTYRPHYGVDYGAPIGTPVRVTAAGVVVSADWARGGGKTVKVRHPNGYVTAYLHLSRFASGIRSGARVRQGQVIAYSGNTGLSSGPHLDYRVQRNGRWIDPLSLREVPSAPIAAADLARYYEWRDACRRNLELGEPLPGFEPAAAAVAPAIAATVAPGLGGNVTAR